MARKTENTTQTAAPGQVLHDFEGQEVTQALVAVRNAGDGLSEAMHFEPFEIQQGDRRFLLLDVTCDDVQFPRIKEKKEPTGKLARKHILRAGTGVLVPKDDEDLVRALIERQEQRVADGREQERIAKERAKGIFTFDGLAEEEVG